MMISSSELFGKWGISPAAAEIVSNCALMVLSKALLLRFVGPHDPTVQGVVELACSEQPLTDPVIKTAPGD
jgi:hypothetical protein